MLQSTVIFAGKKQKNDSSSVVLLNKYEIPDLIFYKVLVLSNNQMIFQTTEITNYDYALNCFKKVHEEVLESEYYEKV